LLKSQKNNCVRVLRHPLICALTALIISSGLALPVQAVDVPTLFTAEVLLDEESENPRDDAYKAALIEVLMRVSGSQLSNDEEAIDELFPVPAAYVTQFRPGAEDTLWVLFDGEAIERVLRAAGQMVWGSDRPLTLVWLAVDWGQGEREIIAAGEPDRVAQESRSIDRNRLLRERVLEIAEKRGLPLAFPLLDTEDLQSVTFSDIWGGFDERIIAASKRYGANSILIGRVRPSSSQRNRWTYIFGGETLTWNGPPEAVVAQVADTLATEFAVGGDAPLEMVHLNISGVQTLDAYGSVQELLAGVSLIENFRISEVAGDVVSYQVEVRGGADRLRRALRFAGLLEQELAGNFGGLEPELELEFFYSP
jgi:hypothetical protein